ncbi:MAG: DinB family protein [Planctomycetaceae bacterium]|nr:DinB family protein [Planctomycetaceae bacterium]
MNAHDAIKQAYGFSQMVLNSYVSDLTDAELLQRPGEGCNHIAWQLGHLISSECGLLNAAVPGSGLELPAGFAENHSKENAASDDAAQFCSKAQYLDLFQKMQTATFAALDGLSDSDLDQPGPEHMRDFCPTMGSLFILISTHVMMHMGQLVPIRRRLGKPVLI